MADQPDQHVEVLHVQVDAAARQLAEAMAPLAEAYLLAAARAGDSMAAWAREVATALEASRGARQDKGDPTGDPPLGRGGG